MQTRAAYVHGMFSAIAGSYDLLNTLLSFNRDKYWRRAAASRAGLKPGERVLDVATGTGRLALELTRRVGREGRVVGVDFCERMLRKADRGKIGLVLADAQSLPFADETFDCVTVGFGLRNIADVRRSLQEMVRVVRPGGRVLSLEFAQPRNRLFWRIYHIFLFRVLPPIGGLLSRRRDAYEYLPRSIVGFLNLQELKRTMEEVGLEDVRVYPLTWGIVTIHVGVKR